MMRLHEIRRSFTAAALVLALTSLPTASWAKTKAEEPVYDPGLEARLADDQIEYEELSDLISRYNPSVAAQNIEYYSQVTTYQELKKTLNQTRAELEDAADDLEKEGDEETAEIYRSNSASLNRTGAGIQEQIDNLVDEKSTKSMKQMENTLLASAQSLMNTYNQLAARRQLTEMQRQLQESAYRDALARAGQGMATEAEVQAAKKGWESAENTLRALDDSMSEARRSLCLTTGWSHEAQPVILGIPEVDEERAAAIDPEADKNRAIGNNYDLQSERHSVSSRANKAKKSSVRSVNENTELLSITMEDLYDDIVTKRTEYEAAVTDWQGALQIYNGLETRRQLGMLSDTEYLQGQVDYLEKETAKKTASMAYYQAVETYEWAVEGLVAESRETTAP